MYKFDKISLHVSWNIARSVHVVKSRSEVLRNGLPAMKIKPGCEVVGSWCFSHGCVFDDIEDFSYSEWSLEKFVIIVVSRCTMCCKKWCVADGSVGRSLYSS